MRKEKAKEERNIEKQKSRRLFAKLTPTPKKEKQDTNSQNKTVDLVKTPFHLFNVPLKTRKLEKAL